jgi:hypothetical protein
MHDFILKFHNTIFYVVLLVIYGSEIKFMDTNANFMSFFLKQCTSG